MHVRRFATAVEVLTPAKLNLFLEVLEKRPDGYHDIETLITAIGVFDSLYFTPRPGSEIRLECRWCLGSAASEAGLGGNTNLPRSPIHDEIPDGPQNLVYRAVELLRTTAQVASGATVLLIKRVPAAAGLGGGSSDAAAALVAANIAWKLHWPLEQLRELAAQIGSDVPFFLTGGAAICRGRGERISEVRSRPLPVVVVRPPVGLGTAPVYKRCQPAPQPASVERIQAALAGGQAREVGQLMHNRLQPAAATVSEWISVLQDCFAKENLVGHQMSGSGSSYFGLCHSGRSARRVAARLRARRMGAVFATTTTACHENLDGCH